jgi:hypothetical protein
MRIMKQQRRQVAKALHEAADIVLIPTQIWTNRQHNGMGHEVHDYRRIAPSLLGWGVTRQHLPVLELALYLGSGRGACSP